MRPIQHGALLLAAMCAFGGTVLQAADEPAATTETVATRQSAFTIPFRLDPPRTIAEMPAEVQLLVSTDRGKSWQLAERVAPDRKGFVYRALRDGEYWFSLRTVDALGQARPQGEPRPGLRVVVDTIAPRLDLTATRGQAGEIIARWQGVDPDLKPDSLRLEYQAGANESWQEVAVEPDASTTSRHTTVGQATWWPKTRTGTISVRAQLSDRAGNPASNQVQVNFDARPGDTASSQTGAPPSPLSGIAPPTTGDPFLRDRQIRSPLGWPAAKSTDQVLSQAQGATAPQPPMDPAWRDGSHAADPPLKTIARPASQQTSTAPSGLDFNLLPPGERPRMVNSRTFEIEYDVDSVGPSGIARVELWGTRDGGRTWTSFANDPDNRSPMTAHVEDEGIYGFCIMLQSGSGIGGEAPREGDKPQIWVAVDLTPPLARIMAADVGRDGSELVIRWEASDALPDARPVSLSWSSGAHGPWSPIATGLQNTGSYAWRVNNRAPNQVYLRLEFRDDAGNLAVYETPDPIPLDRHRPEGRIRGVRPIN